MATTKGLRAVSPILNSSLAISTSGCGLTQVALTRHARRRALRAGAEVEFGSTLLLAETAQG
jgi:hypothetical protein